MQFYKIEPKEKIGVVTVKCIALEPERTSIQVRYKYMALSETGEDFIEAFNEVAYKKFIGEWQQLLLKYFGSECSHNIL